MGFDTEKLDRAVDALNGEVNRRVAGDAPDPRFDLAIDVLFDLDDELASKPPAPPDDAMKRSA